MVRRGILDKIALFVSIFCDCQVEHSTTGTNTDCCVYYWNTHTFNLEQRCRKNTYYVRLYKKLLKKKLGLSRLLVH